MTSISVVLMLVFYRLKDKDISDMRREMSEAKII